MMSSTWRIQNRLANGSSNGQASGLVLAWRLDTGSDLKQFGRPSGLFIDKNDVLYVADSESISQWIVEWTGEWAGLGLEAGYGFRSETIRPTERPFHR